jgi:hypothetical protein
VTCIRFLEYIVKTDVKICRNKRKSSVSGRGNPGKSVAEKFGLQRDRAKFDFAC